MSYIDLMNHFWTIRKREYVSASEADLYYCLLNEFSGAYWPDSLPISNGFLCGVLSMTEKTLIATRHKLKQKGLIDYSSGKQNKTRTSYSLLYCKNYSTSDSTLYSTHYSTSDSTPVKKSTDKSKTEDKDKGSIVARPVDETEKGTSARAKEIARFESERQQEYWQALMELKEANDMTEIFRAKKPLTPSELEKLLTRYTAEEVQATLLEAENWPEIKNRSVYLTVNNWITRKNQKTTKH